MLEPLAATFVGILRRRCHLPCHPSRHAVAPSFINRVLIVDVVLHDVSGVGVERTLQARLSASRTGLHPRHGLLRHLHRPWVDWLTLRRRHLLHQHLHLHTFPLVIVVLIFHFRHRP